MRSFQGERLALAAMGHASAELLLEEASTYARDRKAFGKVLTGHQVIRHRLAEMATQVVAAKSLNYAVGRRIALGDYLVAEVSMAKNFAADVATRVAYDAVQILGGMGYMRESVVERIARDVRLLPIGGGTTEIMNEIIGKTLGI
jgi:acyl-CoA dehydrogenase